ncbi:MAG TPA: SCP2 sterol-binding domain-containing protein [Candidatus Deferrimicrobium sp.]|nr:SCP2 sterol-binding domain-containing protein [Candidatus Deferrimicrobium sp.]
MSVKEILATKVMVYMMGKGLEELSKVDDEFKEEIEDFEAVLQWNIGDTIKMYIQFEEGKVTSFLDAEHAEPTTTFVVEDYAKAREILSGEVDGTSAYMSGDLKMTGDMQAGMRMGQLAEFLQEALSELLS